MWSFFSINYQLEKRKKLLLSTKKKKKNVLRNPKLLLLDPMLTIENKEL